MNEPTATQAIPPARRRWLRSILRAGIRLGLNAMAEIQVSGRENLPESGPLLVVGNHFSFLDPVSLIHTLAYPRLEFIGGVQAPNAPASVGWLRNLYGILPVRRGGSSRETLRRAEQHLVTGGVLCIFPEGGSWATVLRPPRPGAALLAARSGASILPVGLDGLIDVLPEARKGRRAKIRINFGKMFHPVAFSANDRSAREQMENLGHEMMKRISELIPPERRGHYSADPKIREAALGTEVYPWEGTLEG
jgi:1-acyl-sn-glycerol-3-phosphate acyltransferase